MHIILGSVVENQGSLRDPSALSDWIKILNFGQRQAANGRWQGWKASQTAANKIKREKKKRLITHHKASSTGDGTSHVPYTSNKWKLLLAGHGGGDFPFVSRIAKCRISDFGLVHITGRGNLTRRLGDALRTGCEMGSGRWFIKIMHFECWKTLALDTICYVSSVFLLMAACPLCTRGL